MDKHEEEWIALQAVAVGMQNTFGTWHPEVWRKVRDKAAEMFATEITRLQSENAALKIDRDQLEKSLKTVRQSLKERSAARIDATMPLLRKELIPLLRQQADAIYAMAENKEERFLSHGLSLLCDWQDRSRAALAAGGK